MQSSIAFGVWYFAILRYAHIHSHTHTLFLLRTLKSSRTWEFVVCFLLPPYVSPKWLRWLELGWSEARSLLWVFTWMKRLKDLGWLPLPSYSHEQGAGLKWHNCVLNWCLNSLCHAAGSRWNAWSHRQMLNAPHHSPSPPSYSLKKIQRSSRKYRKTIQGNEENVIINKSYNKIKW